MNIILDEKEWAEKALRARSLGSKPTHTLRTLAKYYYSEKYSKSEIRTLLNNFLIACDPSISLAKWSDTIDRIANQADQKKLIRVNGIGITDREMNRIDKLGGVQLRRLAFTLLCVAKYWNCVSKENNYWVNTPDSEIFRMANIRTSSKRGALLFNKLIECGMIRQSKRIDNLNVQVLFNCYGTRVLYITDFRNLGNQYIMYHGGPYFECQNCGLVVRAKTDGVGPKQKYCPDCAVQMRVKANVNSVMRLRNARDVTGLIRS